MSDTPNDTPSRPVLSDLALALAEMARGAVSVACVAKVTAYDRKSGTVDARPLVSVRADDGTMHDAPTVAGIPIQYAAGAGYAITFDVSVGDLGLLLVRDRSHDEVDDGNTTYPVKPASTRRFSLADAVFLPGYAPPGSRGTMAASQASLTLRMPASAKLKIGSTTASKALALAQKVDARLTTLQQAHDTHKHPTAATGPASLPDVLVGALASTASARAFTDDT